MRIVVQSDRENNACYVAFGAAALEPGAVALSKAVTEDVVVDFDKDGRLIGLDVMNASELLGPDLEELEVDSLVGVKEAAQLAGIRRSNFVRDLASRSDFPAPVCELAMGRIWLRSQVEDYLRAREATKTNRRRRPSSSPPIKRTA